MTGIAALFHTDGRPADIALLRQMTSAMGYRGRDQLVHWAEGPVAIGCCRPAFQGDTAATAPDAIDEATAEGAGDGCVAVLAGYLANGPELAARLRERGVLCFGSSDRACVRAAYGLWGEECVSKFRGAFAGLIWDRRARRLVCLRDHLGCKPLHYHWDGATLAVASDVSALLALPWVTESPNLDMVAENLATGWMGGAETLWSGVQRLSPAHWLISDNCAPRVSSYWSPLAVRPISYRLREEYAEHYRDLLFDVVRRHCRSNHPVAFEVSGGLDSSAIFAIAARLARDRHISDAAHHGFTLDFGDHPVANDFAYARSMERHLGVEIKAIAPTIMSQDWVVEASCALRNFPGFPNGTMSVGLMDAARSRGCRSIVDGIGGDEWLGGSAVTYADALSGGHLAVLLRCVRKAAVRRGLGAALRGVLRHGVFEQLPDSLKTSLIRLRRRFAAASAEPSWLAPNFATRLADREAARAAARPKHASPAVLELEAMRTTGYHPTGVEISERLAAYAGLERRSPYLDPDIVEFAYATPAWTRWCGGPAKALHREVCADILSPEIRERRDKAEFTEIYVRQLKSVPQQAWQDTAERLAPMLSKHAHESLADPAAAAARSVMEARRLWTALVLARVIG